MRGAWCVARGAWCVVRGAWCVVRGAWCVVTGSSSTPTQKSGRGRRGVHCAGEQGREGKDEAEREDEGDSSCASSAWGAWCTACTAACTRGCSLYYIRLQPLMHAAAASGTCGCSRASSAFIRAASDGAEGAAVPRSRATLAGLRPHAAVGGSGAGSISPTGSTQWKVTRSRPSASRCDEIQARPCAAAAASLTVLSPMPLERLLARPACSAHACSAHACSAHACSAHACSAHAARTPCTRTCLVYTNGMRRRACPLAPRSKQAEHSAPLIGRRSARSWFVSVTCSSSCPVRCCT